MHLWEFGSEAVCKNDKYKIFLNGQKNEMIQWQEFAHEVAHVMWHVGRQELLPLSFFELQEWQATYFGYHLCIPTFMVEDYTRITPYKVMELFNVEYSFACKRIEMLKNKDVYYGGELLD
ncbi:ImmA/IrrE family metallo-endopeptidase [Oceanobacillus kapialis]|uniref:ImmA/IrrE family metallo-endopeptidase n=1 Tax=Oceanobacillus kapialis TaxID=481353 RepID=A0ABW5Q077_9BACI